MDKCKKARGMDYASTEVINSMPSFGQIIIGKISFEELVVWQFIWILNEMDGFCYIQEFCLLVLPL